SRSTTRRASASMGARGVGGAIAQPARRRRTRALLSGFGALALRTAEPRLRVLDLLLDAVGVRIERQRLLPRGERVFLVAVLGVRVAEVVEDDGVFLGLLDGPLQLPQRVGLLALQVQVAVLVVEQQALAQRLQRAVVLLGAEVRGAEVQEQLRPPWLEVHRLAQHGDRLVEALGAAVEEPELHAGVDRARVGAQDA